MFFRLGRHGLNVFLNGHTVVVEYYQAKYASSVMGSKQLKWVRTFPRDKSFEV